MDIASDVSKRMTPTSKIDKSKPKASTVKYVLRKNNIHRATVYINIINNTLKLDIALKPLAKDLSMFDSLKKN
tara:strand:+ start:245 stop:463 length:219 start_codon:yes stop_codon:yes gene_type:complete